MKCSESGWGHLSHSWTKLGHQQVTDPHSADLQHNSWNQKELLQSSESCEGEWTTDPPQWETHRNPRCWRIYCVTCCCCLVQNLLILRLFLLKPCSCLSSVTGRIIWGNKQEKPDLCPCLGLRGWWCAMRRRGAGVTRAHPERTRSIKQDKTYKRKKQGEITRRVSRDVTKIQSDETTQRRCVMFVPDLMAETWFCSAGS